MSRDFARIVKEQRLDRKGAARRGFPSKALLELAHRARTGTMQVHLKVSFQQRVKSTIRRWIRRVV